MIKRILKDMDIELPKNSIHEKILKYYVGTFELQDTETEFE